jgi:signal transduction histidine kinase
MNTVHIIDICTISKLLLKSSIIGTLILALLISARDFTLWGSLRFQSYIAIVLLGVFFSVYFLQKKGYEQVTNWSIATIYLFITVIVLGVWGINEPLAVLLTGFNVLLCGILLGARSIPYVTIALIILLFVAQIIASIQANSFASFVSLGHSDFWSVFSYTAMVYIFSVIVYLYVRRTETAVTKAILAEKNIRTHSDTLEAELEKQSSLLRQEQLSQIRQLYKFATIGQSAVALLHELSSRLSVVNFDLDDLKLQVKHSATIAKARRSVARINAMVRQARRQLDVLQYDDQTINVYKSITNVIKDMQVHPFRPAIRFRIHAQKFKTTKLSGNIMAFTQIVTILIANACDACHDSIDAMITISLKSEDGRLLISIADTGPGIEPAILDKLFNPLVSSKPNGMGIGLYIARHLTETSFKGTITVKSEPGNTVFTVSLPMNIP